MAYMINHRKILHVFWKLFSFWPYSIKAVLVWFYLSMLSRHLLWV